MSKHRPPVSNTPAPSSDEPITADSELLTILRAKIALRTEIARRQRYREFLALSAELEALPPWPEAPANTSAE